MFTNDLYTLYRNDLASTMWGVKYNVGKHQCENCKFQQKPEHSMLAATITSLYSVPSQPNIFCQDSANSHHTQIFVYSFAYHNNIL